MDRGTMERGTMDRGTQCDPIKVDKGTQWDGRRRVHRRCGHRLMLSDRLMFAHWLMLTHFLEELLAIRSDVRGESADGESANGESPGVVTSRLSAASAATVEAVPSVTEDVREAVVVSGKY